MSGPGSLAHVNKPFIGFLNDFIVNNRVKSVCDFGCGDWQYMRFVNLSHVEYTGFDVATKVLETNTRTFQRENVKFSRTPTDLAKLPPVDLFLSKDTFMHLPNAYVSEVLAHAVGKCKFLLSVSNRAGQAPVNQDIEAGNFRDIDLRAAPFHKPAIELFHYGQDRVYDPNYPTLVSLLLRRYVWPGTKAVQLLLGDRF